jgi:serine O-acetyltransferase
VAAQRPADTVPGEKMSRLGLDLQRKRQIYEADGAAAVSMLRLWLSDGTSANALYRCMRWAADYRLVPIAYFFQYINKILNGCVIGIHADFGPGFVLMHPVGVIINSKVTGGENITLESGVVIGDNKGVSPVLGSDIFVGAGAKIFGGIAIGSGSSIGANAVVCKDVAEGALMLGVPARAHGPDATGNQ